MFILSKINCAILLCIVLLIIVMSKFYSSYCPNKLTQALKIADFESCNDLMLIKTNNASVELSNLYATSGNNSLCVHFTGKATLSSILIEAPFYEMENASVWDQFSVLQFTMYNYSAEEERIILQIKDKSGARFKQDIYLSSRYLTTCVVPISKIAGHVDIRNISSLTLYRWNASNSLTIYLDAIKLCAPLTGC